MHGVDTWIRRRLLHLPPCVGAEAMAIEGIPTDPSDALWGYEIG